MQVCSYKITAQNIIPQLSKQKCMKKLFRKLRQTINDTNEAYLLTEHRSGNICRSITLWCHPGEFTLGKREDGDKFFFLEHVRSALLCSKS